MPFNFFKSKRAAFNSPGDFVKQYEQGEFSAVWKKLRKYKSLSPDLYAESLAVSEATMKRVLHNVNLLAPRLEQRGWKPLSGSMLSEPTADAPNIIREIATGLDCRIPPSVLAFWQTVGSIDFVWDYRQPCSVPKLCENMPVTFAELDPLCIEQPERYELEELEDWIEENREVQTQIRDPYHIGLAPDYHHKINESGAGPYGIEIPFEGADPDFLWSSTRTPFVEYLRMSLRLGGFPRLERYRKRAEVASLLEELTNGFVDF